MSCFSNELEEERQQKQKQSRNVTLPGHVTPQTEPRPDRLAARSENGSLSDSVDAVPYAVALTSRGARGRVYSQHGDLVAFSRQHFPQHLDEGGFPSSGRTGQTCSRKHNKGRRIFRPHITCELYSVA